MSFDLGMQLLQMELRFNPKNSSASTSSPSTFPAHTLTPFHSVSASALMEMLDADADIDAATARIAPATA
jgi:hypothetical protein